MKLLYLHGFRSSPQSSKAQLCLAHVEKLRKMGDKIEWYCPLLRPSPRESMEMVLQHIQHWQGHQMAVIGSSLGGFYAHYIAEYKRCGAVLLNPVVDPAAKMSHDLEGLNPAEQQECADETQQYVEELKALDVALTMPERYFLLLSKDDKVLNYQEAQRYYVGAEKKFLEHSGHRITDFEDHIDEIFDFIGLGVEGL